jgi:two-component system, NarL family, nitrate/nitrite response regulator NarL
LTQKHILVADDHAMMREGIALMVHTEWPGSVCHFASDYAGVISALDTSARHKPRASAYDAVVLDLRMPGMRGAESVSEITQRAGRSPVLVCTALDDPSLLERLGATGVFAVVNKAAGSQEFLSCLRLAVDQPRHPQALKATPQAPRPMPLLVNSDFSNSDFANSDFGASPEPCGSAKLTRRQRDILKLLHQGKPSKIIASQMGIGVGTVKTHLHSLYTVMGASSRAQAIVMSQGWML